MCDFEAIIATTVFLATGIETDFPRRNMQRGKKIVSAAFKILDTQNYYMN